MQTLDALTATLGRPVRLWRQEGGRHGTAAIARWQHGGGRVDFRLHDAVQVIFNVSGGHIVELRFPNGDDSVRTMSAGSVGLNYPGSPSGVTVRAPADTLQIMIGLDMLRAAPAAATVPRAEPAFRSVRTFQAIAVQALVALRRDPECTDELATVVRRAAALLSTTQTSLACQRAPLSPAKRQLVDEMIAARLEANPCTAPTLRQLADVAELSVHHFVKVFYRSAGVTPYAYVTARRVDRALTRILSDDERVGDVADGLGYASPAHFIDAFRKQFGVTPGALRTAARCA